MPRKLKPSSKQKSILALHCVVFAIATVLSLMMYDPHNGHWAYPWPAWTIAAWALALLGHFCIVFASTDDKGFNKYRHEQGFDA